MRAQAKTQNRKTVLRHGGALSLEAGSEGGRQHDTARINIIRAARFVHHVLVLSPKLSRYYSRRGIFHPTRR